MILVNLIIADLYTTEIGTKTSNRVCISAFTYVKNQYIPLFPALRKMEQLEDTLVQVPSGILRLNELLNIPDTHCVYCQCDWPSWNNKNVEGDEVYPRLSSKRQVSRPSTDGTTSGTNTPAVPTCNSSKGQKIDGEFESWVDTGGNAQDGARPIPISARQSKSLTGTRCPSTGSLLMNFMLSGKQST